MLLVLVAALLSGLLAAVVGNAEAASYYAFSSICAVYADSSTLYVADEDAVRAFDENGMELSTLSLGNVTKLERNGNELYALSAGKIYAFSTGSEYLSTSEVITDFTFSSGVLYTVSAGTVACYDASSLARTDTLSFDGAVLAIDSFRSDAYVVYTSGERADVYTISGELYCAQIKYGGSFAATENGLYVVTKGGRRAALTESGCALTDSDRFTVCVGGDKPCFATDDGEVFLNGKLFLARRSTENGFYDSPEGVAARMNKVVVCDRLNNRVAIIKDSGTKYVSLTRPVAAAINNIGEIYVAYGNGKLTKISSDGKSTDLTLPSSVGVIDDVYCDSLNGLFVLSGDSLIELSTGSKPYENVSAICGERAYGKLYAVRGSCVMDGDSTVFDAGSDINALCADEGGAFFYAADGKLYRRQGGASIEIASGLSSRVRLTVSRASCSGFGYGDIIISDAEACRVYAVKAAYAGSTMGTSSAPAVAPYETENIIRSTLYDCSLFASPNETDVSVNVPAETKLIVINDVVNGFSDFSLVGYEDTALKRLLRCYVFRSNLSEPLPYVAPPAAEGKIYAENTYLYSLPSTDSESSDSTIPVDTKVTLLSFAQYSDSVKWYRAEYGDSIGYIVSSAVSIRSFIPEFERPQYNAVVKAYGDNYAAPLFKLEDGKFVKLDGEFLTVGTKLEVVGAFDTSEKYTRVKYFDDELGTLTCYIETVYLRYNSVSVVQIVALAIVAVTLVLLFIVLIRVRKRNRA